MSKHTVVNVENVYKHIDNGGIIVNMNIKDFDDGFSIPSISISTQYHGYASVTSTLEGLEIDAAFLNELADKLKLFAVELENRRIAAMGLESL